MAAGNRARTVEILLVEDNLADIRLTQEAMKESRMTNALHVVRSGPEAQQFLRRRGGFSGAPRPDLILLDLNLPGMDGHELLADIKADEKLRRIPVVVLTSSSADDDIVESYNLHANCFISKPVTMTGFVDVVHSVDGFWFSIVQLPRSDDRMRMDTIEKHARISAGPGAGASPRATPRQDDTERGYRILLVEDNRADALIVEDYLRAECGSRVACACVETVAAARTMLEREAFDAILLDLNLPDAQGIDGVVTVIQIAPATPVIVLTATRDNEIGYRAVGLGAEDFVNKQTIDSAALLRTIRHAIERHHLRVALERNLREMEAAHGRSLSLVDGNADAIVVIDRKGTFRFVNPAAERMLNRSAEALRGHVLGVSVDDALPSELKFLGPNGETRVAEIHAMDAVWEGEHSYIATLRDVTERKEGERLLRVAKQAAEEANAMKSEFLANMSHELRTPLNAIIGFTQLMLLEPMGPVGNAKYREYLEIINRGGEHLLSLIDDLLDLSKAESGMLMLAESDFALTDVIVAAVQLVRTPADTGKVAVEIEQGLPRALVRADPRLIKQVLINLLDNGVKFTPEGGNVSVFVRPLSDGGLRIGVRDTGVGLPEAQISKAFASFMQLDRAYVRGSNQGTGLGLALCKRIMESHGGAIAMTSQVGVGTVVHCDLPSRRVISLRAGGG